MFITTHSLEKFKLQKYCKTGIYSISFKEDNQAGKNNS